LSASGRSSAIKAGVRFAEETLSNKLIEQHLACRLIELPQPTCLRERHSQPGHFEVFAPNTSDKRFKQQRHQRSSLLVKHLMNKGDGN
jgi:hypothetical protein